jgi:lysophospholipid hydrolase
VAEKTTGCVSSSLNFLNRHWEKFVADSSAPPLFTPLGEEPQALVPKWKLPFIKRSKKDGDNNNSSSNNSLRSHAIDPSTNSHADLNGLELKSSSRNTSNDNWGSTSLHSNTSGSSGRDTIGAKGSTGTGTSLATDGSNDLPHFFSSTKLLACLDLEDSRELFESAKIIRLGPEETLFHSGDDSRGGTYIVVEGSLGVFLHDKDRMEEGAPPMHTNTLQEGESVGDLDIVDGDNRSVTCVALEEGAMLVEISRELFMEFVTQKPRALQVYLQQAIARLWRVANFVLNDTLQIPQSKGRHEMFDVVPSAKVGLLDGELLSLLLDNQVGHHMTLPAGMSLYEEGTPADAFYILLKGKMLIEKAQDNSPGGSNFSAMNSGSGSGSVSASGSNHTPKKTSTIADIVSPHCIIGSASYFTSTARKQSVRALELSEVVAIGVVELEKLRITSTKAFVSLLVTAARAMGPLIRKFISLGLNRVWLHAHDIPFRQGEPSSCIYITISGRMILAQEDTSTGKTRTEEVAERGEAIGAVWSLSGGGLNEKTAMCTRDSELVRMSGGAFQCISTKYPSAAVRLLEGMAQRLGSAHGDKRKKSQKKRIATVALIPLHGQAKMCDAKALELKQALERHGPTLLLSGGKIGMAFPLVAERLTNRFYRSKLTAWMAAQEEDYTYIILQADPEMTEWSKICVAQADCVLLLSDASEQPRVSSFEHNLVWRHVNRTKRLIKEFALQSFRVELVLVHQHRASPTQTRKWLEERHGLERHHHMINSDTKDMERLARWLAGKAVGLVLSGGGSRGLAHLGVLRALDDAGVPIDIVGGTSQGAFMAGLFAQRLPWDRMFSCVQEYAAGLGTFRSVVTDLTLPVLSLFAGKRFTHLVTQSFRYGPENIEDLWLRFFCVSTNLSKGEPSVHEYGRLAHLVRASMTVVGLLPPVYDDGDLLVDGGYLNNIPIDVMRTQMGVDTLIVVDVEDKDFCSWNDLAPYENGLSGFYLLWQSLRSALLRKPFRYPRYGEMINSLFFLSHQQQIKASMKEFHVDLYMRPTGVQFFKLMDYHLMDRIVRDAYRYGWTAITEWQCNTAAQGRNNNGQGGVGEGNVMRLRTRSISKVHSHDFVSQIKPSTFITLQESSVERIQSALAEKTRLGSPGLDQNKFLARTSAVPQSPRNYNRKKKKNPFKSAKDPLTDTDTERDTMVAGAAAADNNNHHRHVQVGEGKEGKEHKQKLDRNGMNQQELQVNVNVNGKNSQGHNHDQNGNGNGTPGGKKLYLNVVAGDGEGDGCSSAEEGEENSFKIRTNLHDKKRRVQSCNTLSQYKYAN